MGETKNKTKSILGTVAKVAGAVALGAGIIAACVAAAPVVAVAAAVGAVACAVGAVALTSKAVLHATDGEWKEAAFDIIGAAFFVAGSFQSGKMFIGATNQIKLAGTVKPNTNTVSNGGPTKNTSSPDFVVTTKGDVIPVPKGATGPTPVTNSAGNTTGVAYTGGSGGANGQVSTVRIMNPTPPRGASPGYPNGYVKYENISKQGVDPITGRTISNKVSHFPLN